MPYAKEKKVKNGGTLMCLFDKIHWKKSKKKNIVPLENAEAYQQRLSKLTTLEYKIFMLLREGFSERECSQRLNMKRGDVTINVKEILDKLNVKSLAELIVKYHEGR